MCIATTLPGRIMASKYYRKKSDSDAPGADAKDVPLGSGLASNARLSIMSRRARLNQALGDESFD